MTSKLLIIFAGLLLIAGVIAAIDPDSGNGSAYVKAFSDTL